jgi:hypothetical protein|tara:strand:+ start:4316 stop:4678 length:363 start_codon:yes stop_codon:yes gene_type:complete
MGSKKTEPVKPAKKKKNYGAGGKRKAIRASINASGAKATFGRSTLSINPKLTSKSADVDFNVPIGRSALTLSGDPRAKSARAELNVPIKRSTLTVRGSADPGERSVGVKLTVPLGGKRKK